MYSTTPRLAFPIMCYDQTNQLLSLLKSCVKLAQRRELYRVAGIIGTRPKFLRHHYPAAWEHKRNQLTDVLQDC